MQPNLPKLYLNMIIGDFEPVETVKRCLDSVKNYVDGMYITITYKEADPNKHSPLVKLLKKYNAEVSYFKWVYDFSVARQFALDQVPKGPDIFMYWQDVDDVIQNGERLKDIVFDMFSMGVTAAFLNYWYQVTLKPDGQIDQVLVKQKRERIVRNDGTFKWVGALHEILIEQRVENVLKYLKKEVSVLHLSDHERMDTNIQRNKEILEKMVERTKRKDPRPIIYLAKVYFDEAKMAKEEDRKSLLDKALLLFHEYLNGSGKPGDAGYQEPSGWHEERSTAWSHVGEIAIMGGHPEIAVNAFQSAIDEAPEFPSYYVDLAMAYVMVNDFKKAKHWLAVATTIPEPETSIVTYPQQLLTRSLETSFQINMHEGKLELAEADMKKLIEINPANPDLQQRLEAASSLNAFNRACQSVVYLGKYLEQVKETDKIQYLLKAMSKDMQRERFAAEMRHKFQPRRKWADNEIAILCGPGVGQWSPVSTAKGLGGSEEAVVYLGQELTKLGWKITVFANPEAEEGVYDGVEYRPWYEWNPFDEYNVLVLWRTIGVVDANPKSKMTLVWLHDVPVNPDFTEARVAKVDKIAVLSEFHKSLLRLHNKEGAFVPMPENKVFLTANGIPTLQVEKWDGDPHKMIYISSPDRGLPYLLKHWSKIHAEVPDATLDVYYGFETYDVLHRGNPARMKWKEQMLQLMKQPGISYKGRLGHQQLHEVIAKAGIWAYPTDFEEISCISAMKAQALGAVPVVTDYAALSETVKNGIRVDANITTEEGQKEYIESLIKLLKNPKEQDEIRKTMIPFARDYFHWSNVAAQWNQLFKSYVNTKVQDAEIV